MLNCTNFYFTLSRFSPVAANSVQFKTFEKIGAMFGVVKEYSVTRCDFGPMAGNLVVLLPISIFMNSFRSSLRKFSADT